MTKIGLISDTHGVFLPSIEKYFKGCDEIWHVGDIGSMAVIHQLSQIAPVKAVYGNIDMTEIRTAFPEVMRFTCEQVDVLMTHIGGYPGRYAKGMKNLFKEHNVDLFISGHSHILKVMYDKNFELLHVNPGAAGNSGFHQVKTIVRFEIDGKNIQHLEVVELGKRV